MQIFKLPFNVIHSDDIDNVICIGVGNGKLSVRHEIHSIFKNDKLPIVLRWIYRIHKNNDILFSCICEDEFLLQFGYYEQPESDLKKMVYDSFLLFKNHWREVIKHTQIDANVLPEIPSENIDKIVKDVLDVAQSLDLLSK